MVVDGASERRGATRAQGMEKFIPEFRTRGKARKVAGAKYIRFGFQQLIRPCFEGSAPEKREE